MIFLFPSFQERLFPYRGGLGRGFFVPAGTTKHLRDELIFGQAITANSFVLFMTVF
jgi:hypothetical protein